MIDRELVSKKLAFIETCVRELRTLARVEALGRDVKEERFVEHTLQLAIQAAMDVASHVVSDERLGEPRTNRDLFDSIGRAGLISPELGEVLGDMAGFRNLLVHGYGDIDLEIVRDVVENHMADLLAFVEAMRGRNR